MKHVEKPSRIVVPARDWYWNWLTHSDTLAATQSGLFLVADTILIPVAFTTDQVGWPAAVRTGIAHGVGLSLAVVWLLHAWRYDRHTRDYILRRVSAHEPRWVAYIAWRKATKGIRIPNYTIAGLTPPILFTIVWLALAIIQILVWRGP